MSVSRYYLRHRPHEVPERRAATGSVTLCEWKAHLASADTRHLRNDSSTTDHGSGDSIQAGLGDSGGESGSGARPMWIKWAQDLRDECKEAGVSFFMKQLGSANKSWSDGKREYKITGKGDNPAEWPEDLRVQEFPK
jgi:hypothetical protein